jgi:hypothetical protein
LGGKTISPEAVSPIGMPPPGGVPTVTDDASLPCWGNIYFESVDACGLVGMLYLKRPRRAYQACHQRQHHQMKENPEDVAEDAGQQICREVAGTSH